MARDYSYYFSQLRKIEAHREKEAEAEIRKLYKGLLKETKQFVADEYFELAEDGKLTYEILRSHARDARFLEEVEERLGGLTKQVSEEIKSTVADMYSLAYSGIHDTVKMGAPEHLKELVDGLGGATAEMIKAVVDNPVATVALEKNYKDTIYGIRQQIATGLMVGDRYDTMAKRLAKALDISYKKATTIVRTETERAREAGHFESAKEVNDALKQGVTEMRMTKTWKTMKDGRVRDTHSSMDGKLVAMDDMFVLPSGAETLAPKQSGVASEDINCRCYVSYKLMSDEQFFKATGKHLCEISKTGEPYSLGPQPGDKLTQEEYTKFKKDLEKSSGKGFDDAEIKAMADAVRTYTEGDYTDILAAGADFKGVYGDYAILMSDTQKEAAKANYENVEKFLEYANKHKGTVYRGLGFDIGGDYDDGSFDDLMATLRKGKPVEMPSLTSWSTKKSYMQDIFEARTELDDTAEAVARVTFVMSDSKSGVSIRDYAQVKGQEEVLFSKHTKFDILDISKDSYLDDDGVEYIDIVVKMKEHT